MGKYLRRGLAAAPAIGILLFVLSSTASATVQMAPAGQGVLFGAYVNPTNVWTSTDRSAEIASVESSLGRPLDISHEYASWNSKLPDWEATWNDSVGRTTLISWSHAPVSPVVSGSQDAYISSVADGLKTLTHPVMLEYFWEMDLHRYDSATGSPANFIAAWRHIHDIFVARGATNVEFVWCPSAYGFVTGTAQKYYSGSRLRGLDLRRRIQLGQRQATEGADVQGHFQGPVRLRRAHGQAADGWRVRDGGLRLRVTRGMVNYMATSLPTMPAIKAVVYFDSLDTKNNWDWRVTPTNPAVGAPSTPSGVEPVLQHHRADDTLKAEATGGVV